MKKGEIKKFPGIKYSLYNADAKFIGHIDNEAEFLQVRIDLATEGAEGFFVMKQNGDRITINQDGSISDEDHDGSCSLRNTLAITTRGGKRIYKSDRNRHGYEIEHL